MGERLRELWLDVQQLAEMPALADRQPACRAALLCGRAGLFNPVQRPGDVAAGETSLIHFHLLRPRAASPLLRAASALALLAASASAQVNATWASCCGPSDASCVKWATMVFTPPAPAPGTTMVVNGTGVTTAAVTGGTGMINAFLYDVDVFDAAITTCGESSIDVMGLATGTLDALACPVTASQNVSVGFVLPIPQEAQGLGQLVININATDSTGNIIAYCIQVNATL